MSERQSDRLPSLAGLQAFEAVARHLSFARAADELGLTPTAISHRIRNLEGEIGVTLFRRGRRSVALTCEGERAAKDVSESFDCLKVSVAKLRQRSSTQLRVAAAPSFASEWLLARLPEFTARHPTIELRIDPSSQAPDFEQLASDAAIVFGCQSQAPIASDRLFESRLIPVCSPDFHERFGPFDSREALDDVQLIHTDDANLLPPLPGWQDWLKAAGASQLSALTGARFGACHMGIEAARLGQGLALGLSTLIADDLKAGRLVAPLDLSLPIPHVYALVYPREHRTRPALRLFRSWLLGYARRGR